jgi:hypothetical protein
MIGMTVAAQVKQTLVSMKAAKASFEALVVKTSIPEAKVTFKEAINNLNTMIDSLDKRVVELEIEEPQYKGQ